MIPIRAASLAVAAALFLGTLSPGTQGKPKDDPKEILLDFQGKSLPNDWQVTNKAWKVEDGELRGEGNGALDRTVPMSGDFTLTFDGWTEEKGTFEVRLLDPKTNEVFHTFCFMGQYHPVLDGVKSCILKGNMFVAVNPRMWIFPGRLFHFEVRTARSQYQMFLNGELGPVFVDPDQPDASREFKIQLACSIEGKKDKIRIDNLKIVPKK
jgi:hypothetical protein